MRRVFALVLLLALVAPVAAGARNAYMDPNGSPTVTTTATDPAGGTERNADMDPDGLRFPAPVPGDWLGSIVRAFFVWMGI
jgi:hypothetical protein